jgi:hypothetical protein
MWGDLPKREEKSTDETNIRGDRRWVIPAQKPNSCTYNFVEVSGHNLEILRLKISIYNVKSTNQFKQLLFGGWGGGPLVEVTVNSKEKKS